MNIPPNRYKLIARLLLVAVLIISSFSFYQFRKIKFDYNFESFFPSNDNELEYYLDFRNKFEYDNEFMLIAIENSKGVFQKDFLEKVQSLTDSLKEIRNITRVTSPTNLKSPVISPVGYIEIPYLHVSEPEKLKDDSAYIYQSPELIGSFFSKDAKSLSIFIKTKEFIAKLPSDTLLHRVENLLGSYHFEKTHIAGKIKAQYVYIDKITKEFELFFILSFLLIVVFLIISFRSFWGVWIPIVVVLLSIIWLLGFISFIGKPLDLMTVLLPTMIFVVGMSDVVHIISKYLEEAREGQDKMTALKVTLKEVGFPTFLTLVTTAVGFLSLLYLPIKPIRDFGIYTSFGVLIAFVLSFVLIPVIVVLMKKPIEIKERNNKVFWFKHLHSLLLWVFRNKMKITYISIGIVILSFIGISKIKVNHFLLGDIPNNDTLKKDFAFFENKFSGVRPFELSIKTKDSNKTLFDKKILNEVDSLESFLKTEYGVGYIASPVTLVKALNRAMNSGLNDYFKIPQDSSLAEVVSAIKKNKKRSELKMFISEDAHSGRITGKIKDIGSFEVRKLNEKLEKYIAEKCSGEVEYKLTGAATLLDKSNEYLVLNTLQGLLSSVLIVSLIIAFIHRSTKMVIISIIPNIIPMILIGGLMGFAGIDLKASTSIIFSIAFGISTDDTIHFLSRLKIELAKGRSVLYAIKRTYISTGKAVVVTALILSGGFLTLIASDFESTFYFGFLVSIILFVAVFADLLLLPPLLLWLANKRKR